MSAPVSTEVRLAATFLRTGAARAGLVALCTALVSGLLLVAIAVLRFDAASGQRHGQVSNLVADSGVRGGYVFALGLICLAPLVLLHQVVRLGTASREERLAALRLAGATPAEVRRLGALEVGLPALAGGFLGYLVYRGLGTAFDLVADPGTGLVGPDVARELRLVPTDVGPSWWQAVLVALFVGLLGVLAGRSTSRALEVTPHGVARRAPRSAPRPWGVLLLAASALMIGVAPTASKDELYVLAALTLLVLGVLSLAPWIAHRVGRAVSARSSTAPVVLAARRLAADARPAGRAAAAVGVISMIAGGGGALLTDVLGGGGGQGGVEAMYAVPVVMSGVVLLVALTLVVLAMAVHGVETLTDSRRSTASLAAMGMSTEELGAVQRWEVGLVALPMAVLGVLIGSGPTALLSGIAGRDVWVPLTVDLGAIVLVWLAVLASTWITTPWLRRAMSPTNLRTS